MTIRLFQVTSPPLITTLILMLAIVVIIPLETDVLLLKNTEIMIKVLSIPKIVLAIPKKAMEFLLVIQSILY